MKATISSGYIWRPALFGIAGLLMGGWFFYDGYVGYPLLNEKAALYLQYHELDQLEEKWDPLARERGWSTANPGAAKSSTSLLAQKILGTICLVVGVICVGNCLISIRRWVACDNGQLTTSSGQTAAFDDITSVDSDRWRSKGIAVIHFRNDRGSGRIVLDDWKFDREATIEIYNAVQAHINPDLVITEADDDASQDPVSEPTA